MIAWTPPQPVSPGYPIATMPSLAVTGDGTALAAWHLNRGTRMRVLPGGTVRALPAGALEAQPVVAYGRHRVAVAASHALPPTRRRVRLTVRLARAGAKLGRPVFDVVRPDVSRPVLAANVRGDLAYAWIENAGVRDDRLYVAVRRAGGRFGAPHLVTRDRLRNATVAVGAGGRVLLAWDTAGAVHVRFRGRTRRLRSAPAHTQQLRARVDDGRPLVAWDAQAVSSGGDIGTGYVEVATDGRTARLLDTIPAGTPVNGIALAARDVVWASAGGVRSAPIRGGPARDLATGNFHVDAAAGTIAAFTRDAYDDAGTVFAADLTDGTVAQLSTAPNAREAAVAPGTVLWVDRPGGRDVLETATRSPTRRRAAAAPPSRGTPARSR